VTICLFIGPTLPQKEAASLGDLIILPPAAQGDVWRAAQVRPRGIGIVDGYFCGAPSVWHKEILWALSRGIHVFGSSSMGALRAAELHAFGMRGIGRIFEAYRDGRLEDDDEVAVSHGPAELGYPALSEAMVNIRATLARAEAEGVLAPAARRSLEARAKGLHFPERNWAALLDEASGADRAALDGLRGWLPQGRVDQKRADALEMIAAMEEALAQPEPPTVSFRFEWTHLWDEMIARAETGGPGSEAAQDAAVLEELRLESPDTYGRAHDRALARLLGGPAAARLGISVPHEALAATLRRLRAERGLYDRAALDAWMAENGLDAAAMERLIEDEARLEAVAASAGPALDAALADELRLIGAWPRLARRARDKSAALSAEGSAPPANPIPQRRWFFERRLGRPVPDDLAGFVRTLGFDGIKDFDKALHREIMYVKLTTDRDG
jgi:hypothetical protein